MPNFASGCLYLLGSINHCRGVLFICLFYNIIILITIVIHIAITVMQTVYILIRCRVLWREPCLTMSI